MILSRLSTNSFRDSKLFRLSLSVPHCVRDLHILSGSGLTDHRPQAWRDKAGQQEGFRSPICRTGFWTDHGPGADRHLPADLLSSHRNKKVAWLNKTTPNLTKACCEIVYSF
ncbi:hypothetical protein AMECASPLE_007458 [Ameca splendens]|uniref:Uncharacterized protein n=1 Tax=Ameca splendens TaxID=208324 RepID=A0ABV0YN00_9TELE